MVYQEPGKALNPSIRIGRQVAEVYEVAGLSKSEAMDRAAEMLARVQIPAPAGHGALPAPAVGRDGAAGGHRDGYRRRPLAADPGRADHRARRDRRGRGTRPDRRAAGRAQTSLLFISHNLAVIAKMCDRVGVLYAGELVEEGPASQVFAPPATRTRSGWCAAFRGRGQRKDHGRLDSIPGFLPQPGDTLPGCIFAPRCPIAEDRCHQAPPPPYDVGSGRTSRCYRHEETADLPRNTPVDVELRTSADETASRSSRSATYPRLSRKRRGCAGTARRQPGRAARRDARPGRRVGQRQDHAGARAARSRPRRSRRDRVTERRAAGGEVSGRSREQLRACRSSSRTRTRR